MNFARPEWLWLLGTLPLLILWGIRSARLRRSGWEALAQRGKPPGEGTAWWIAAGFFAILALAQPKWGFPRSEKLPPGHDVVFMVDVSRSMGAEDAVPSRLGVAKESARSLIETLARQPGNRVALVAFAGRGVLRCPLTENSGAVLDALNRLKPGDVRPGGTDLAAGLVAALDAFDRQEHEDGRTILIFSDGEDLANRWERALPNDRLRRERVIIHAIAIGDPEHGHPVPVAGPATKSEPATATHPLIFQGETVLSRRVDKALDAIARGSGGTVIPLGLASADLGSLYTSKIEPVSLRTRAELRIGERIDRFPWFVLASFVIALIGSLPRRVRGAYSGHRSTFRKRLSQLSWSSLCRRLGAFRPKRAVGGVAATALMLTIAGAGDERQAAESVAKVIDRGIAAYQAGQFQQALEAFESAIRRDPALAVPRYNAAAARYQLGQYEEAYAAYLEVRTRAEPVLRTKIDYDLGNAALACGDVAKAIEHYDDCLASTAGGEALASVRRDASINREFAIEQSKAVGANEAPQPEEEAKEGRDRAQPKSGKEPGEAVGDEDHPPNEPNPEDGSTASPGRRRRSGGAGGEGNQGESARDNPQSPDRLLDDAIEQIREARRRRLPDDELPPDQGSQDDRKDW